MRDGYHATWHGREYEASPDGDQIRLYATHADEGFTQVRPGRYVKVVPGSETTDFSYVRTVCSWRGEPFLVLGEHEEWLRVEYTGGKAPVAKKHNLEEFDFGVYQGWAPQAEVTDLREYRL